MAMTANAFESDKQMAFDSGMDGHISKPIDMDKMKSEIVHILTKNKCLWVLFLYNPYFGVLI